MHDEQSSDLAAEPQLNVDADHLHLVVTPVELDILVDALRSVGNSELAERFETILRHSGYGWGHEQDV